MDRQLLNPTPHRLGVKSPKADDPRFYEVVHPAAEIEGKADIGIIGIPSDLGVKYSLGRVGASLAPNVIRDQLLQYGTATNIVHGADLRKLSIADLGNVRVTEDIFETHKYATLATAAGLESADTLIILGGSHDLSFPTTAALSKKYGGDIAGANIDAHFDVRPVINNMITSGTPFRRLIEGNFLKGKDYFVIGAQGHTNSAEHYRWLKDNESRVYFLGEVKKHGVDKAMEKLFLSALGWKTLFVSIDIDSVAHGFAPGSSAPSPDGFFPEDILRIAFLAGRNPKVKLFEIMEVNPLYDVEDMTARLAANIILEFCAGRALAKN